MTAHYALVGQNGILEPRRFLGDEIRLEIMHLSPRLEIMHLSPLQFCLQVLKISANWQVVDIWLDGIVPIFSVWELRYKRQSPSTKLSHGARRGGAIAVEYDGELCGASHVLRRNARSQQARRADVTLQPFGSVFVDIVEARIA